MSHLLLLLPLGLTQNDLDLSCDKGKFIMLDPTARERQGCCHSTSLAPTISKAEVVVPASTSTQNTHTHYLYIYYIYTHTHTRTHIVYYIDDRLTLRAFTQIQTAPVATSCFPHWLDRMRVQ